MSLPYKKALVLAPHTDDGELGCGATISRLISEGCEVYYVAFTDCKIALPIGFPLDTLEKEMMRSTKLLQINKVSLLDFPLRNFDTRRQEILDVMVDIKNEYKPDLIFTPARNDVHQDHQVITNESIRAFKMSTILGYELPWNNFTLPSECLIKVSQADVDQKVISIMEYKSQGHRKYMSPEFIRSLAITRGCRINEDFAEAFEPIRIIL